MDIKIINDDLIDGLNISIELLELVMKHEDSFSDALKADLELFASNRLSVKVDKAVCKISNGIKVK